jgi:hypothetical protein
MPSEYAASVDMRDTIPTIPTARAIADMMRKHRSSFADTLRFFTSVPPTNQTIYILDAGYGI